MRKFRVEMRERIKGGRNNRRIVRTREESVKGIRES